MADLVLDFEWHRAPRYEVAAIRPFEAWPVVGGERFGVIVPKGKPKKFKPNTAVFDEAIKRLLEVSQKFDLKADPPAPALKTHLHAVVPKLAQAIGMLHHESEPSSSEGIAMWGLLAQSLGFLFDPKALSEQLVIGGEYQIFLLRKEGGFRLAARPTRMFNAVMIYAAQSISSGAGHKVCEVCSSLFLTGGVKGKNKKRAGARFCSDKCRADFHNATARKTKPR